MNIPKSKGSYLVWTITDKGLNLKSKMYSNIKIAIQRWCYDSNRAVPPNFEIERVNDNSYFVPYHIELSRYGYKDCHGWVVQRIDPPKDKDLARFIEIAKTMSI